MSRRLFVFGLFVLVIALAGHLPAGEKKAAEGKSLFDGKTLAGWKVTNFGGEGEVHVTDGNLVMEQGNNMTGVTYAGKDFPRTNYEVTLEGRRTKGNDFFCTTTFPVGDEFCSFVVGGWGGTVIGISSINALDASENETSSNYDFEKNKWYAVRIRVTKDRIQSWIGDKKVVDVATNDRRFTTRIECDPCKPFGIASYATTGAVRAVRVRPLTADELKK